MRVGSLESTAARSWCPWSAGRVAQRESARFTRERSLVRNQPCPSKSLQMDHFVSAHSSCVRCERSLGWWDRLEVPRRIQLSRINDRVVDDAARMEPDEMRSLNAIHLASA